VTAQPPPEEARAPCGCEVRMVNAAYWQFQGCSRHITIIQMLADRDAEIGRLRDALGNIMFILRTDISCQNTVPYAAGNLMDQLVCEAEALLARRKEE